MCSGSLRSVGKLVQVWSGGDALTALKWVQQVALHVLSGRTPIAWAVPTEALQAEAKAAKRAQSLTVLETKSIAPVWHNVQSMAAEVLLGLNQADVARRVAAVEPRRAAEVGLYVGSLMASATYLYRNGVLNMINRSGC